MNPKPTVSLMLVMLVMAKVITQKEAKRLLKTANVKLEGLEIEHMSFEQFLNVLRSE